MPRDYFPQFFFYILYESGETIEDIAELGQGGQKIAVRLAR